MKILLKRCINDVNFARFCLKLDLQHEIGIRAFEEVSGGRDIKIPTEKIVEISNLAKSVEILLAEGNINEVKKVLKNQLKIIEAENLKHNEYLKKLVIPKINKFFDNYISHRKFDRHNTEKNKDYFESLKKKVVDFFENYKGIVRDFISNLVEESLGIDRDRRPGHNIYIEAWKNGELFHVSYSSLFHKYYNSRGSFLIENDNSFSTENHIKNFLKALDINNGYDKDGNEIKTPGIQEMMRILEKIV